MENISKHWMIGLDLTHMDEIITGYVSFLSAVNAPDKITFFHIMEQVEIDSELRELFPEITEMESLKSLMSEKLNRKVNHHFEGDTSNIDVVIKEGSPTEAMLALLSEYDPDLLILGKKSGYEGEGMLPQKTVKYTHCSILFISENSRFSLDNLLVPISFSKTSARTLEQAKMLASQHHAQLHLQHVYDYPKQFFPFIPSEKYTERMNSYLEEKFTKFKKKYKFKNLPDCYFAVNEEGGEVDQIYEYALQTQADLIMIGSKRKSSTAALLTEDIADHMAGYRFGCPVLVYKEKKEHFGLLRSLLEQD